MLTPSLQAVLLIKSLSVGVCQSFSPTFQTIRSLKCSSKFSSAELSTSYQGLAAHATLKKAKLGDSTLKIAVIEPFRDVLVSIKRSIGLVWGTRQNNIDRATSSSNQEPYTNLDACFIVFFIFRCFDIAHSAAWDSLARTKKDVPMS